MAEQILTDEMIDRAVAAYWTTFGGGTSKPSDAVRLAIRDAIEATGLVTRYMVLQQKTITGMIDMSRTMADTVAGMKDDHIAELEAEIEGLRAAMEQIATQPVEMGLNGYPTSNQTAVRIAIKALTPSAEADSDE